MGCWQQMIDSQQYRSVLMYKNKGPLRAAASSIHMQIVGLEQEDGYAALTSANLKASMFRRGRPRKHLNRADHGIL
ncbi:MAG: DUF4931 domain-containing protein [Collinsella sp.]